MLIPIDITDAFDGVRVDRVVAIATGLSRSSVAALVDAEAVDVDGAPVSSAAMKVHLGQRVTVTLSDDVPAETLVADPSIIYTVVHVDDDLIIIDKPAGLVVHPGSGNEQGTLVHGLLAQFPEIAEIGQAGRPGIVHRLDKGTSGLMMVARSALAYDSLVGQLSTHDAGRRYLALCWGSPDTSGGVIDAPIGRSRRDPLRMAVTTEGKHARTHYEVLVRYDAPVVASLLRCSLETGRTHQIRVHLAAIKHPVVGDPMYRGLRQGLSAPRPMLHAAELELDHPRTGERLVFTSPMPDDLAAVLSTLHEQVPDAHA